MVNHDAALRGGKVEEIAREALLDVFQFQNEGVRPQAIHPEYVRIIAAALRTHAQESAAQSGRAGLERAAAWHDEQAKQSWQGSAKLPNYECHVKSAKALRALSAARKAGGE